MDHPVINTFNQISAIVLEGEAEIEGRNLEKRDGYGIEHYEEDDEDMLEVGMEMSRMAKLPFEYIKIEV